MSLGSQVTQMSHLARFTPFSYRTRSASFGVANCRKRPSGGLVDGRVSRAKPATRLGRQRVAEDLSEKVVTENDIAGMTELLDGLKWGPTNLVVVMVQNIDTGECCMQAFADRAAICETMQTGLATFYSRSRAGRWCKGETSGHFIQVHRIFPDCDKDSIIYLGRPIGPACHTGERTCWWQELGLSSDKDGVFERRAEPRTTLYALEDTIQERKEGIEAGTGKKSWTAKLLSDDALLCSKIREEASELCQTLEQSEGTDRAANEMADLLYHSMVLLNKQGVGMEDVLQILRGRFGTSGIDEKNSRGKF